ncbi:flagellar M-ring protein FliF [Novosphingobium chloroacetimidivorans]|uniref:Flagellar M-ring protein n=1 Tax=Novosphingobium chloroacetimidivorans TaxID=1428314 RepID=A0A7W7K8C4_9SPHN|nr:flagellar basal-body MS-ring/collar protein FliF [Novosphingobium chloroacetimidivorans]MBB4858100.1 flagellar M-ring protein FliF [Novosphingobium chloroacetimidivorans]
MADLVPAAPGGVPPGTSILTPLTDPAGGSVLTRMSAFTAQPAVKRMLPWFLGVAALGGAALTWAAVAPSPQRVLYSQLEDGERAGVVAALDTANIGYHIDNETGALTVDESDFYKARMLVASDGALATPETGDQMLDKLPMGASRNLEGQRLRSARERDLQLSIMEIDGVESVRVHLAEAEKSVFVRENLAPTASVMVRLKSGRQLSDGQVSAIVNLVAASVPGLSPDAVRVVDQHGSLLSAARSGDSDRLDMQARMEDKLRAQVSQILRPMLGEGSFSSEVQVELNMDDVTSARESYDKDGVVRSETQEQSQSTGSAPAVGIPGVLSNTPPPATQAQNGPPQGTQAPANGQPPANGESSSTRTYELGREVSVSNQRPGGIKRLSVAVVLSKEAMKGAKAKDLADIEALVAAAVGANPQRGDQVKVVSRSFEAVDDTPPAFYETPWFATLVRYGAAVIAVLLVLLLAVRPLIAKIGGDKAAKPKKGKKGAAANDEDDDDVARIGPAGSVAQIAMTKRDENGVDVDISRSELLARQVELAQRIVAEKHGSSVQALRQMLNETPGQPGPQAEAA